MRDFGNHQQEGQDLTQKSPLPKHHTIDTRRTCRTMMIPCCPGNPNAFCLSLCRVISKRMGAFGNVWSHSWGWHHDLQKCKHPSSHSTPSKIKEQHQFGESLFWFPPLPFKYPPNLPAFWFSDQSVSTVTLPSFPNQPSQSKPVAHEPFSKRLTVTFVCLDHLVSIQPWNLMHMVTCFYSAFKRHRYLVATENRSLAVDATATHTGATKFGVWRLTVRDAKQSTNNTTLKRISILQPLCSPLNGLISLAAELLRR